MNFTIGVAVFSLTSFFQRVRIRQYNFCPFVAVTATGGITHSTAQGVLSPRKSAPLGLASGNDYITWLSARLKAVMSFN